MMAGKTTQTRTLNSLNQIHSINSTPTCSINLFLFLLWIHRVAVRAKWQDSYICIQHSTYRFSVYRRYRTFICTLSHSGMLVNLLIFPTRYPTKLSFFVFCRHLYVTSLRLLIFTSILHSFPYSLRMLFLPSKQPDRPNHGCPSDRCYSFSLVGELRHHWRHCLLSHCLIKVFGYVYFLLSGLKGN
jgi:hypothetical protein